MAIKRRKFIRDIGITGMATLLSPVGFSRVYARKNLKILVLGGTNFVGPHFVNQALRRGHEITLFNRGITNSDMFPYLEHIKGNRLPNVDAGISGLEGIRKWDAIVDTWQGPPGCVALTAELLKNRTDHYLYISSIATYKAYRNHGMTEDAPTLDMAAERHSYSEDLGYSERKCAAEHAVLEFFPENGSILRCGSIRGESYSTIQEAEDFYHHHMRLGNTLVLPDDNEAKFQLIDVKDLANFGMNLIDKHSAGIFNMVGPGEPLGFRDYILGIHRATEYISTIHWVDYNWLKERNVVPFSDLPTYIPMSDSEPGFYTISNARAIEAGLTFRPVFTTIVESLGNLSVDQLRKTTSANGLSEDRRRSLINEWTGRPAEN